MAEFIAFPLARRPHDIAKVANNMLARDHAEAEEYFEGFKSRARRPLRKQGLSAAQIDEQLRYFETAVRVAVWRHVLLGGGAA